MLGQGSFPGVVDFGVADFCGGVGVVGVVAVLAAVLELGAAAAPAIPEAAPPAASAPATIVAPSILDTFMRRPPGGGWDWNLANHLGRDH
jgi:hypothetical protein